MVMLGFMVSGVIFLVMLLVAVLMAIMMMPLASLMFLMIMLVMLLRLVFLMGVVFMAFMVSMVFMVSVSVVLMMFVVVRVMLLMGLFVAVIVLVVLSLGFPRRKASEEAFIHITRWLGWCILGAALAVTMIFNASWSVLPLDEVLDKLLLLSLRVILSLVLRMQ